MALVRIPSGMALDELDKILPDLVNKGLPGGGEFLCADIDDHNNTPGLIALLIWHGFLPMGGLGMLLPKIHASRCILPPSDIHIGRKTRRRANGYSLALNTAWPAVVRGIQEHTYTQDRDDCWLSDKLAAAYEAVNSLGHEARRGVAFHSVELWHSESGKLVAGEIGYTCGNVYSSVTGFALKAEFPGAGGVQLAALGRWLEHSKFVLWDLGMELDYKRDLGADVVPRREWAKWVRSQREVRADLQAPVGDEGAASGLIAKKATAEESAEGTRKKERQGAES